MTLKASEANYTGGIGAQIQDVTLRIVDDQNIIISTTGGSATLSRPNNTPTTPFTSTGASTLSATLEENGFILFGQISETPGTSTTNSETFFVTGFETDPANLTGTATYNGTAEIVARNISGGTPAAANTTILDGTFAMTVDFGSRNVTAGSMSGTSDTGGQTTLTLAPAPFSGNNFSTTATSSGTSGITMSNVNINGIFFGPNGERVGGVVSGNVDAGMPSGSPSVAAGYFEGS
jgi:hypothetical protein